MAVRFTPQFDKNSLIKGIYERIARLEKVVLDIFIETGEEFVIDARNTNTYKDRTGNLRSSIGYTILKNGEEIFGSFEGVQEEGKEQAKRFVKEIQTKFKKGYVLIVVAGMNYGAAVEAKGFDVITAASQDAEASIKRSIDNLRKKLSKVR